MTNSTHDWPFLWDVYLSLLGLTRSSKKLAEDLMRDFFAYGPIDAEGRDRYWIRKTEVKFPGRPFYSGQPIYNPRDPAFWYPDSECGISCDFDFKNHSVRWIGPTIRPVDKDAQENVWEIDSQFGAEYHLKGIKLRPEAVREFQRSAGLLSAESPVPKPTAEEPSPPEPELPPQQAAAGDQSKPPEAPRASMPAFATAKEFVHWAAEHYPPDKVVVDDYFGFLQEKAGSRWSKKTLANRWSEMEREANK